MRSWPNYSKLDTGYNLAQMSSFIGGDHYAPIGQCMQQGAIPGLASVSKAEGWPYCRRLRSKHRQNLILQVPSLHSVLTALHVWSCISCTTTHMLFLRLLRSLQPTTPGLPPSVCGCRQMLSRWMSVSMLCSADCNFASDGQSNCTSPASSRSLRLGGWFQGGGVSLRQENCSLC